MPPPSAGVGGSGSIFGFLGRNKGMKHAQQCYQAVHGSRNRERQPQQRLLTHSRTVPMPATRTTLAQSCGDRPLRVMLLKEALKALQELLRRPVGHAEMAGWRAEGRDQHRKHVGGSALAIWSRRWARRAHDRAGRGVQAPTTSNRQHPQTVARGSRTHPSVDRGG